MTRRSPRRAALRWAGAATLGALVLSSTTALSQGGPYADGDTVHARAVPAKGHVFVDWLLDGERYGGDEEGHEGRTAVDFDESGHTLTAVFAPK